MNRTRRLGTRAGLLIGLGLLLAACGGSEVGDPVAAPEPAAEAGTSDGQNPEPRPAPVVDTEPAAPEAPEPADCSASGATVVPESSVELPAEVVALRDLLLDAALRCDEQLLRTAMDESDMFTYTFGTPGDAIGAWWDMEQKGQAPWLRMAQVLGTTPALADGGDVYVWPRVATGRSEDTTDAAWAELRWLDDPAGQAEAAGDYLDWRLGISTDGQWRFFVAGD